MRGKPLMQKVLYRKEDKVTVYPKLNDRTKLYEVEGEIDPLKYKGQALRSEGCYRGRRHSFER